jgi:NAD(P)-dependent dehydrogenase (short-subunit alcohol dehydrogenase family)
MRDRIALVTGANRGIGYETCRQLGKRGYHVLLAARDSDKAETAAAKLRQDGLNMTAVTLDVSSESAANDLARMIESQYGRLDALVNNAGVYLDEGISLFDIPSETLHTTLNTNFYGAFYLIRAFTPMMIRQKYGRIVNVSSEMGALSEMTARTTAYRLSKLALNGLTLIVADELRRFADIKVNAVCPGWVRTDMGGSGAPRTPEQGADTIVWLAMLPSNGVSGGFWQDRQRILW